MTEAQQQKLEEAEAELRKQFDSAVIVVRAGGEVSARWTHDAATSIGLLRVGEILVEKTL